jgi:cell division protein FtsB
MLTYAVVQVLEERVRQCVSEAQELRARNEELEVNVYTLC